MPPRWLEQLDHHLHTLDAAALRRRLSPLTSPPVNSGETSGGCVVVREGRTLVNLASNDYLGLSRHPRLIEAVRDAAHRYGVGSGASRLVSGTLDLHAQLEQRFAAFKHAPAALLCPTGFMANLALLGSLLRPGDLVFLDKLCHASLIDAARASRATLRTFPHLDTKRLEHLLQAAEPRRPDARCLIVTDSVFSMDGDTADLPALVQLAHRYDALLIVDEAHATGILGEGGRGLTHHQGVSTEPIVCVSTASKALGSLGGLITGPQTVIDTIVNLGRSFIYTTATPPTQLAAILAALDVLHDEPHHAQRLEQIIHHIAPPASPPNPKHPPTPIIPLILGEPDAALKAHEQFLAAGLLTACVRPPTVPPGSSRLRISLRADLPDAAVESLHRLIASLPPLPTRAPRPAP